MWSLLRVVVFEWILARMALRWVLLIAVLAVGGLIFFIGLPTLLAITGLVVGWRWLKRRTDATAAGVAPPA